MLGIITTGGNGICRPREERVVRATNHNADTYLRWIVIGCLPEPPDAPSVGYLQNKLRRLIAVLSQGKEYVNKETKDGREKDRIGKTDRM